MENSLQDFDRIPRLLDDLREHVVTADQFAEAEKRSLDTNLSVVRSLLALDYLSSAQLRVALNRVTGIPIIDVRTEEIDSSAIETIPESVARENEVLPIREDGETLTIAISDPSNLELVEKIRFILNRPIEVVLDTADSIQFAIDHYYGLVEGESATSVMQEFCDTSIDFSDTEPNELR